MRNPGKRSKRVNIIAAKSRGNIIFFYVFEEKCNGEVFKNYIKNKLCPLLTPGKIIIMDNATFHKGKEIKEQIEKHQRILLYLPPYSPERNPIEHYWAVLKRSLKHFRKMISDITESIILSLEKTKLFGQL